MKENRRFRVSFIGDNIIFKTPLMFPLLCITLAVIFSQAFYSQYMNKYAAELDSYSINTYDHLVNIYNDVIQEGTGIDLSALPKDVVSYEITRKGDEVTFKFSLDTDSNIPLAPSAEMSIKLSSDFHVISQEPNYFSAKACITNTRLQIRSFFIGVALIVAFAIYGIYGIVIACFELNKSKNKTRPNN